MFLHTCGEDSEPWVPLMFYRNHCFHSNFNIILLSNKFSYYVQH